MSSAVRSIFGKPSASVATFRLDEAYRAGWVLLELDDEEQPVAAYRLGQGGESSENDGELDAELG
jgi:hypothetical protein